MVRRVVFEQKSMVTAVSTRRFSWAVMLSARKIYDFWRKTV